MTPSHPSVLKKGAEVAVFNFQGVFLDPKGGERSTQKGMAGRERWVFSHRFLVKLGSIFVSLSHHFFFGINFQVIWHPKSLGVSLLLCQFFFTSRTLALRWQVTAPSVVWVVLPVAPQEAAWNVPWRDFFCWGGIF